MAHAIEVSEPDQALRRRRWPSTTCRSPSTRGGSSASWAPTARARRRRCGCCSGSSTRRPAARRSSAPATSTSTIPVHTVGAVLDGGMLHPGRSGRNHLRALAKAAGVPDARVDELLAARRAQRRRRTAAPAATRSACASGSAWRPRCSATRGCWCSTSPPTAWTRRASAGCATSCARSPREGRAVLVSSHVLAEVSQTADDVVVINRGRSVAQAHADRADRPQRRRHEGRRARRAAACASC